MYSLVFLSARALSNRDKSILCGFSDQYPEIYNIILDIDGIRDKMENVFDCIEELYYNQIRNRYPQQKEGIVCVPLLKCCLMNQSIWVVPTGPLTMEIMPMAQ